MYHTQGKEVHICENSNQKARAGGLGDQGQPGLHKDILPHKRGNSEKIVHPSDKNDNKLGSYYKQFYNVIRDIEKKKRREEPGAMNGACIRS